MLLIYTHLHIKIDFYISKNIYDLHWKSLRQHVMRINDNILSTLHINVKNACHPKQVETETYSFCFSKLSKAKLEEDYPKKHPI